MGFLKKLSIFTTGFSITSGVVFYYWVTDPTNYYQNKRKCLDFYYQSLKSKPSSSN